MSRTSPSWSTDRHRYVCRQSDYHLVEGPSVARAWAAPPQLSCDPGPEFQHPAPHRLIGNLQAALGEEFLNVAVAQCEPEIKPDRVLDDRRREAMPSVGELIHAGSLPHGLAPLELRFRDNARHAARPALPPDD